MVASGSASRPRVPANGRRIAKLPACQPACGPYSRAAIRATSHGSDAATSRNGSRSASAWSPNTVVPSRVSHAVSPGRSE
jgi:hypothetical protein